MSRGVNIERVEWNEIYEFMSDAYIGS